MHAEARGQPQPFFSGAIYPGFCLFVFVFFKDLFYLFYVSSCCCLQTHQKRGLDPVTDGCKPPCGCWELNSGPLEEQSVFLTAEPSLQPYFCVCACVCVLSENTHVISPTFQNFRYCRLNHSLTTVHPISPPPDMPQEYFQKKS